MTAGAVTIKKYSNRKLYDTEQSRYVTLEELAEMIRQGKAIRVVDADTDEDLTSVTLTQILLEGEKQKRHPLPVEFLHQLVQYGEAMQAALQQALAPHLDTFLKAQREGEKQLQELAKAGGKVAGGWLAPMEAWWRSMEPRAQGESDRTALKAEVDALRARLKELEEKLGEG
ncbi:MAG TPA: polyhydroxyalkanoate synthesis regulator DNA-binding domain-containing protein [Candidatus Methylomirabilis sp.]|jgi:polyhydroxyalkanoate synthesis repressor PhaR|nr:polyhydroxyalkanoate synthesis regulator DNA-binding domain-containing protein [Candidatus Methylomirabilis sp.]